VKPLVAIGKCSDGGRLVCVCICAHVCMCVWICACSVCGVWVYVGMRCVR
jgi:hypothetical protein